MRSGESFFVPLPTTVVTMPSRDARNDEQQIIVCQGGSLCTLNLKLAAFLFSMLLLSSCFIKKEECLNIRVVEVQKGRPANISITAQVFDSCNHYEPVDNLEMSKLTGSRIADNQLLSQVEEHLSRGSFIMGHWSRIPIINGQPRNVMASLCVSKETIIFTIQIIVASVFIDIISAPSFFPSIRQ